MGNVVNTHRDIVVLSAVTQRPNNTTAYAAGQVIGPTPGVPLSFPRAARAPGGAITIPFVRVVSNAPEANFSPIVVAFFGASPTPQNDQTAYDFAFSATAGALAESQLSEYSSGTAASSQAGDVGFAALVLPTGTLYALIVSVGVFTPAANQQFRLEVTVERF